MAVATWELLRTVSSNPFLSANFLNRNDSQAQVARWKCPATASFSDGAVDRVGAQTAGKCSRDRIFLYAC
jgi:hypothetical protein